MVQNRTSRVYGEDEVEDLQIIAMVLAEMVAAGDLIDPLQLKDVELSPQRPERLRGQKLADGLALGVAVLHEAPVAIGKLLSDDPVAEEARLTKAITELQAQIDEMLEGHKAVLGPSYELLETYKMLAYSRSWNRSLTEAVRSGVTAEVAEQLRIPLDHSARRATTTCASGYMTSRISTTACCAI